MEFATLIAQSTTESNGILTYVPLTILFLILAPIVYVTLKAAQQYSELHKRSLLHMDQLEAKTDEMIGLLKEIRDKR
jgi:large-conductance mechanosensitive channel